MPMTVSEVHINRPLTNLLLRRQVGGFAIPSIFPDLQVQKESDLFFRFNAASLITVPRSERAPASAYNRVDYRIETATYSCQEYGLEHAVDDRIRENADDPLRPLENAARILQDLLLLDMERRGYNAIVNAGVPSSTPSVKWNGTNPTIVRDIKNAAKAVADACGLYPNTIVIPLDVWLVISEDSDVRNRLAVTQPRVLTREMFGSLVEIPNVIIAGAVTNAAKEGLAVSLQRIWGDNVLLAYVNPQPAIEQPAFGYTFTTTRWVVEQYREEQTRSTVVRVRRVYDLRVVMPDAGYLLTDVLT